MRTILEIQEEIKKVQTSKRAAQQKLIRCDGRLAELDAELQKSVAVKCVCDDCMYMQPCPAERGEGTVVKKAGKITYCSVIKLEEE